jgi:hypothetical protein
LNRKACTSAIFYTPKERSKYLKNSAFYAWLFCRESVIERRLALSHYFLPRLGVCMFRLFFITVLSLTGFHAQFSSLNAGCSPQCHCTEEKSCGCLSGGQCHCNNNDTTASQKQATDAYENITATGVDWNWEDLGTFTDVSSGEGMEFFSSSSSISEVDENLSAKSEIWEWQNDPEWNCDESKRYCWPGFIPRDNPTFGPCCITGAWMPERPPLFRPFIADPRQPTYSIGWRFNDNALAKNVIDVSYYDSFPIYGWCNYLICGDKMQIDLEGCLWAVFDPCSHTTPLMNADYYVAIPVTYAYKQWSARIRVFHVSSHVGDEFLLENPGFDRRNPSAEYLDGFISYYLTDDIRLYGGLGWVMQQDDSFYVGNFYAEGGVEARICPLGRCDRWNRIYGVPFIAMYFRQWKNFRHHIDATYALGYEVGKTNGLERRLRIYLAYHDGYSVEGQWSRTPTNYLSLKLQYGF